MLSGRLPCISFISSTHTGEANVAALSLSQVRTRTFSGRTPATSDSSFSKDVRPHTAVASSSTVLLSICSGVAGSRGWAVRAARTALVPEPCS